MLMTTGSSKINTGIATMPIVHQKRKRKRFVYIIMKTVGVFSFFGYYVVYVYRDV